jgi:hypothetical protein
VQGLSFDVAFLKKLSHKGPVQAVSKDRGTSFAVSVEQLFVDADVQPGSSGTGFFNAERKLVMAPLSYRWDFVSNLPPPNSYQDAAQLSASGTSSRVAKPLTDRMLNPATPPNGADNYYHIPSLGIIPYDVVSAINLWDNWGGSSYYPYTQNRGIIFAFLATQAYYDYLTTTVSECGFGAYTVTPPSLLNAPLDVTISGTPPATMPDFPGGGTYTGVGFMVILEAIEPTLGRHDWVYLGEDAGLQTVTGVLMGAKKWVGDVVRVRIRAIDTNALTDPTHNWEAIYSVTLQAVDPFFDSLHIDAFSSYVSYLRINTTAPGPAMVYADPSASMPIHMRGHRRRASKDHAHLNHRKRNALSRQIITDIPEEVNVYSLPSLAEDYSKRQMSKRNAGKKHLAVPQHKVQAKTAVTPHRPVRSRARVSIE